MTRGPENLSSRQARKARRQASFDAREQGVENPSRRILFFAAAEVVVGGFLAGKVALNSPARTESVQIEPKEEYSGEVEETKALLSKWNREVGRDAKKLEKHAPQIVEVALRYFGKQMTEIVPEKASDYSYEVLKNKISIVSEAELIKRFHDFACENPIFPDTVDATTDTVTSHVNVSPQRTARISPKYNITDLVSQFFLVSLHEMIHSTATRVKNGSPVSIFGFARPVDEQIGLTGFTLDKEVSRRNGKDCLGSYLTMVNIEEIVVEDAASELASQVGVENKSPSLVNDNKVYRQRVRRLFGGDYKELLRYQQKSDVEGYLAAVGAKLGGGSRQEQIMRGVQYLNASLR